MPSLATGPDTAARASHARRESDAKWSTIVEVGDTLVEREAECCCIDNNKEEQAIAVGGGGGGDGISLAQRALYLSHMGAHLLIASPSTVAANGD